MGTTRVSGGLYLVAGPCIMLIALAVLLACSARARRYLLRRCGLREWEAAPFLATFGVLGLIVSIWPAHPTLRGVGAVLFLATPPVLAFLVALGHSRRSWLERNSVRPADELTLSELLDGFERQ